MAYRRVRPSSFLSWGNFWGNNLDYVPEESAKAIAEKHSEAMPIAAELVSSGYTSVGDAAYAKLRLLGPARLSEKKIMKQ